MPCDRLKLLHDYARLCAQQPGDSYRTAHRLLQHLSQSLNLCYAAFLSLDTQGQQITRACGTPTAPAWLLQSQPLAGTPWQQFVRQGTPGQTGSDWICPVRNSRGICGLLVCGLEDGTEFCEADRRVAQAVADSLQTVLSAGKSREPFDEHDGSARQLREFRLLYRVSRALHSTLNLDELTHLVLSAAVVPAGAGFERAMLFTANEKTMTLQGMLGVSRASALKVLSVGAEDLTQDMAHLDPGVIEMQRATLLNRKVIKQRLALDAADNALATAYFTGHVVLAPQPDREAPASVRLAQQLELGPYACAPLSGRGRGFGVLLVDNPISQEPITPACLWFLELFASLAGAALENAQLVRRLEQAHENLREVQERLIHGEKLAVLGEMAAQVAHELKNPLVSIGGFAQRLTRQEPGDPRSKEYATIIAREVTRMEEMLGNILAFSKKQLVCLEECNVRDLLGEALELEMDHCRRVGIVIEQRVSESVPKIIGDCRQLRQVLLNLLVNARQAMPRGGKITVQIDPCTLRGAAAVEIAVEDTGGGIPTEVIRNIFNPFFSTNPKGTGLGLSISHRIIEHHHGELEVINSELGARFIVRLPVQPVGDGHH